MNTTKSVFDCLVVTNVQCYPIKEPKGKIRAFARVMLNSQLQLTGLRVVEGELGLFVGYPLDPMGNKEDYQSVYFPVVKDLKEHIEACVLEKYWEVTRALAGGEA